MCFAEYCEKHFGSGKDYSFGILIITFCYCTLRSALGATNHCINVSVQPPYCNTAATPPYYEVHSGQRSINLIAIMTQNC